MLWYAGFRHITSERFIVEPRGGDDGQVLVIDRVTQEISLQGQFFLCSFEKNIWHVSRKHFGISFVHHFIAHLMMMQYNASLFSLWGNLRVSNKERRSLVFRKDAAKCTISHCYTKFNF